MELQSKDVDAQLAELLKQRDSIRSSQQQLFGEYLPSLLVPLISDSSRLENSLLDASVVAEKVSRKVRAVDLIRKRAVDALDRANDALSLRRCVEGVRVSLSSGNFKRAVEYMSVYLRFSARQLVDSETMSVMSRAESQLLSSLREQLSKAIANNSISEMTRLTKLFSPLGMFDEGVRHYATYLEKQIDSDLSAITNAARDSAKAAKEKGTGEKASFAAAISQITQRAHARLKRAKPVLEQAFGPSGLIHAVLLLQPIVNSHISTLIDQFIASWEQFKPQLADMAKFSAQAEASATATSFMSLSSYATTTSEPSMTWNPMLFAPLLDQLVIICQTIEVHSRFISAVISQAHEALAKERLTSSAVSSSSPTHAHNTETTSDQHSTLSEPHGSHQLDKKDGPPSGETAETVSIEVHREKVEDFSKKLVASVQMGPLSERLLELLSHYMRFEQYYMNRSVQHVIDVDSAADEARFGTLVDDVFFLLKESSNRARATYNANTLCAVMNFVDSELNGKYYETLQERSSRESLQLARAGGHSSSSSSSSSSMSQGQHAQPSAKGVLVAINQLEQTASYIARLKTDVEEPSKKIFAPPAPPHSSSSSLLPSSSSLSSPSSSSSHRQSEANTPRNRQPQTQNHDLDKVLVCCEELLRTEAKYRNLISTQMQQIAEAIQPRFNPIFTSIAQANYNLTMELYSQYQINDPLVLQLIQNTSEIMAPIEHVLTQTNASILTTTLMRLLVKQMERAVTKKVFTQLGAEQLERDIRKLVDYFSLRTPTGVARDAFHRLSQIAYLLNFDTLEDIQEEWNVRIVSRTDLEKAVWSLSPSDLRRVLSLRTDFAKEAITQLVLREK